MRPTAAALAALMLFVAAPALAAPSPFQPWIDGTKPGEPQTQTQRVGRDTYVIRQSLLTSFEAPFLYLLFGKDRALLLDTGAGGVKIRPAVDAAVAQWLAEHHRVAIPLVVAHSHGHGDHHAGDEEFRDRPDTTVVGLKPEEVAAFFKVADWPRQIVTFDLGGRRLQVIPTPGHQPAHIMIWDPKTRWLLSGDSLYPGRLYVPVNRFADYRDSIDRVSAFANDHPVSWVVGAHIEMTREPGKDLPDKPPHPNEHALELPYATLVELRRAVDAMGEKVVRDVHADFIVVPAPPR